MTDEEKQSIVTAVLTAQSGQAAPGAQAQQGAPPAPAAPPAGIDYDKLAAAMVRQGGQQQPAGQAAQTGPAPTMAQLLQSMGAQAGALGQPTPPTAAAPRKVNNLEQQGGYVDVFSLTDEQVNAMPIEKLVEHFEKAKNAARAQSGAPMLPKALRKAGR